MNDLLVNVTVDADLTLDQSIRFSETLDGLAASALEQGIKLEVREGFSKENIHVVVTTSKHPDAKALLQNHEFATSPHQGAFTSVVENQIQIFIFADELPNWNSRKKAKGTLFAVLTREIIGHALEISRTLRRGDEIHANYVQHRGHIVTKEFLEKVLAAEFKPDFITQAPRIIRRAIADANYWINVPTTQGFWDETLALPEPKPCKLLHLPKQ